MFGRLLFAVWVDCDNLTLTPLPEHCEIVGVDEDTVSRVVRGFTEDAEGGRFWDADF